jgi:hypothetical protein
MARIRFGADQAARWRQPSNWRHCFLNWESIVHITAYDAVVASAASTHISAPYVLAALQVSAQADVAHKFIITPVNGTVTLAQVNAQVKGIQFLTFTDVIPWSKKLNATLVNPSTIAVTFTTTKAHGLVNKLEIEGTANVTGRIKGKHAPAVGTIINATQVITVVQVSWQLPQLLTQ